MLQARSFSGAVFGTELLSRGGVCSCPGFRSCSGTQDAGTNPPGALHLAQASNLFATFRSEVTSGLARYEAALADPDQLSILGFFCPAMNNVKIAVSQTVPQIIEPCHADHRQSWLQRTAQAVQPWAPSARCAIGAADDFETTAFRRIRRTLLLIHKIETGLLG